MPAPREEMRGAHVAKLAAGQRTQQIRLDDCEVMDDRCRAIDNILERPERSGGVGLREAYHR